MISMRSQSGFSLVELSIVLVILGLLTGGILAGQALIRAAELRAVSTEYNRYVTAAQTFRDKYYALPGDMPNATAFWGAADGSNGRTYLCHTMGAPSETVTCNGNGDGLVLTAENTESLSFWEHLKNAGMIEGSYNGMNGSGGNNEVRPDGVSSPRSKIGSDIGWAVKGELGANTTTSFNHNLGNYFIFGAYQPNNIPINAALMPEEAWNIDSKVDDGVAGSGKVIPYLRVNCTFAGWASGDANLFSSQYRLNDRARRCALYFREAL